MKEKSPVLYFTEGFIAIKTVKLYNWPIVIILNGFQTEWRKTKQPDVRGCERKGGRGRHERRIYMGEMTSGGGNKRERD